MILIGMETIIVSDNLVQHLINWFNANSKTAISDLNRANAIKVQADWIIIQVDSINAAYSSYFYRNLFHKNAEPLSKKLIEVVKEWMNKDLSNFLLMHHIIRYKSRIAPKFAYK